MSALIKHYEVFIEPTILAQTDKVCLQQFEDVKEKVEELVPQLDRFKQNITTTIVDGDPEETNRRIGLARCVHVLRLTVIMTATASRRRTFKQVEELSDKLSAKSAFIRFVDRGEDSKVVARLIERLREAIVCYQVRYYYYHPQSSVLDRDQISQQQAIYRQITHLTVSLRRHIPGIGAN